MRRMLEFGPSSIATATLLAMVLFGRSSLAFEDYCGPVTQQQRDNRLLIGVLEPPELLTFGPPPEDFDDGYCNSVFGVNVHRLTKQELTGRSTYVVNSERNAFNSTGEFFMAGRAGWLVLFAYDGNEIHDFRVSDHIRADDVRMSRNEPSRFLWRDGDELKWCDYSGWTSGGTGPLDCTSIGSAAGDWAGGDGNDITDDDRYLLLRQGADAVVIDLTDASVVFRTPLPSGTLDYATMSSRGGFILAFLGGTDRQARYLDWQAGGDWKLLVPWNVHTELGTSPSGDELVFLCVELGSHPVLGPYDQWVNDTLPHEPGVAVGPDDIIALNLTQSRFVKPLFRLAPSGSYVHIAYHVPPLNSEWLYASTIKQLCPTAETMSDWLPYESEVLEIATDGSGYVQASSGTLTGARRLIHTYSTTCGGATFMQAQADLALDPNATRVVFRGAVLQPDNDLYMFEVPGRGGAGGQAGAGGSAGNAGAGASAGGSAGFAGQTGSGAASSGGSGPSAGGSPPTDESEGCGCRQQPALPKVPWVSALVGLLLCWARWRCRSKG